MKRVMYAVLFLLVGGVALYMGFHVGGEIGAKRDWPTAPGKILERGVGAPMTVKRSFLPHVKYTYEVGGKTYTNDQVYLIRNTGGLEHEIKKLVDGLPDPVPVHYNPEDPQDAYLIVNPAGTKWIIVAVGALAILIGLGTLLVALTKKSA